MAAATTTDGQRQLTHRQVLIVFGGLMIAMLLSALDQTIVATALPTIVGDLGDVQRLSWVISAYLLTSTASVPLYGKLSDLYGRKLFLQFGIVVFLVGSALSGASQNMMELILCRGLQGLGAGGMMIMAQAVIGDIVSPRERGRYQGYSGTVFAFASVVGPLVGGLFTDHLSWRWVFYVNLPLGIVGLFVIAAVLRLPERRLQHRIDYLGAALMVGGVSCLLLVATWAGTEYAWTSTIIVGLLVAGIGLLALFVLQEMRASEPLLPLRLFKSAIFSVSSAVGFIVGLAMFGAIAFLPLYLQIVKDVSATSSGIRLTPMMVGFVATSIASGLLITRTGRYRVFPIAGTAIMTVGLYLLSTIGARTGMVVISGFILILGVGLGLVMQVIVLAVQNDAEASDLGTATSGVNFFRSMGGAIGVSIFGSILTSRLDYYLPRFVPASSSQGLSSGSLTGSPAALRSLPPAIHAGVIEAFAHSLHVVFLVTIPIAFLAFALTFLLHEIPLREHAHVGFEASPESEAAESVASASGGS